MLTYLGKSIATDPQGYLQQLTDWHEDIARLLAEQEAISLTDAHWEVIYFVRDFYQTYQISPAMRVLVKALSQKYGPEIGNSRYLFRLFPKGPAKQATKIAGLPKPVKCL